MNASTLSFAVRSIVLAVCFGWFGSQSAFAQATPKLYSVDRSSPSLRELNPATGATVSSVTMTLAGETIGGATGLAADPTTGTFYALLRLGTISARNPSARRLVTVNVTTGVATNIGVAGGGGNLGPSPAMADLAFDASGTLYGIIGNGSSSSQKQLVTLNKTNGTATSFMTLSNGNDGAAIAYNSDNGLLYHAAGLNEQGLIPPPANLFFESINLATKANPTRITLGGGTAIQEAAALAYAGGGAFLWSSLDFNDDNIFRLMRVTTAGVITLVGVTDHVATGLAFVPVVTPPNPAPTISSTTPASVGAGSGAFTLTVTGTGFVSGSTVQWNGTNRVTTFVSGTQLTASIAAADVATAGSAQVTVVNPAPGGGTSAARSFSITAPSGNPVPTITSTSPASVAAGSGAFTLTVTGTGFVSASTVRWNGANRTTTFVSATQLTAVISAADVASTGTAQVTVTNPAPGGGTSGAWTFTITAIGINPVPSITSISPASAVAVSGPFTLTVTGTGFISSSIVQWNGASRTTTYISTTQLTASILAGDIATVGTAQVTVLNPAPGGGTSAPRSFSITASPPSGPLTLAFIEPSNGATYLTSEPIPIRLSVGGDQTNVADLFVTFQGSTIALTPPNFSGNFIPAIGDSFAPGRQHILAHARTPEGTVIASASTSIEVFLVHDSFRSCLAVAIARLLQPLSSPPSLSPAPATGASATHLSQTFRQALLTTAADLLEIDLDVFRAFRDNVLSATPAGRYYTDLYERTSFSLIGIAAREPMQALAIHQTLLDWSPAIRALVNQQGSTVTITPAMATQVQTLLTNLRRSATGELATIMDAEIAALNPSTWSGLTIGQLLARVESQPRTPPPLVAPGRISNLSIRSAAGTGAQTLIVGTVIRGESPLSTKPLLIRGIGPALTVFGVPGALADPVLTVYAGSSVVASNDNWGGDAQVTAVGNALGAFGLAPATSRDAALYAPALAPRDYTIQITGAGGGTGVALAEVYDATPADTFTSTRPQLVNVSARTQVGTGADILIAGFTLAGDQPRRLLIRAVGPTLGAFGVAGTLADPQLTLFSGANRLQENNDWGAATNAAEVTAATTQLGTFPLGAGARDSAILTTLQPGSYTAQISGVGNTTGVALVEIYVLP
ncbi:MAG: hypothetical protein JNK23_01320 [Opitutaceae bacterium]|nr:hypothetical protein [Opitutaceae bacterium]